MKKYITIFGITAVLGISIYLGTLTAHNVNQSDQNDILNQWSEESEDSNLAASNKSKKSNNINTREDNTNSIDGNTIKTESAKVSENMVDPSMESSEESKDTNTDNSSMDDAYNIDTSEINMNSHEEDNNSYESDTNESEEDSIEFHPMDDSTVNINNSLDSSETEEDEAIAVALNITNPSINIDASSAILLDSETGKVLFHKNATTKVYPASTTKIITALVAMNYCELDDKITIGDEITYIASDSSRANLIKGQRLTMKMLLEAMLLPSGNDAAYSIATYVGRMSLSKKADNRTAIKEFVRLMNEKAIELGLRSTQFMNPDGYDEEGQYTTAYDMGILAIEALKNKTIREIAGLTSVTHTLLSGETVTWNSSNKLIASGSGEYYEYAIGLKTGSSSKAGKCLVSAAEKDGKEYVSVIMNSSSLGRWEDSISLLKYGINHN